MANTQSNNNSATPEQQLEQAIVSKASTSVQSVSVDGVSTAYQTIDPINALSALQRQKASKNPLSCLKIFKVK